MTSVRKALMLITGSCIRPKKNYCLFGIAFHLIEIPLPHDYILLAKKVYLYEDFTFLSKFIKLNFKFEKNPYPLSPGIRNLQEAILNKLFKNCIKNYNSITLKETLFLMKLYNHLKPP